MLVPRLLALFWRFCKLWEVDLARRLLRADLWRLCMALGFCLVLYFLACCDINNFHHMIPLPWTELSCLDYHGKLKPLRQNKTFFKLFLLGIEVTAMSRAGFSLLWDAQNDFVFLLWNPSIKFGSSFYNVKIIWKRILSSFKLSIPSWLQPPLIISSISSSESRT